jgi:hypothetical protein
MALFTVTLAQRAPFCKRGLPKYSAVTAYMRHAPAFYKIEQISPARITRNPNPKTAPRDTIVPQYLVSATGDDAHVATL